MSYTVDLTAKAKRDIAEVLRWFDDQKAEAAGDRWLDNLLDQIGTLPRTADGCPCAAEAESLGRNLRELHFGKRSGQYRILFVINRQSISILHIRHAARDAITRDDL